MLDQGQSAIRKRFICLFFLLLAFHWWHCDAANDLASRLLSRVHKVSKSLSQENAKRWNLHNLHDCNYKQQMYADSIDGAKTAQGFEKLVIVLKECTSIYASGSTSSGIYPIWIKERFQFTYVYCDMELVSIKKGWTTIQRRMNGQVNFNRGWDDYVRGFGNPRGEYWLGLENIYRLSRQTTTYSGEFHSPKPPEIGFDLEDWDGVKAFAEYTFFKYQPKEFNYKLYVAGRNTSSCFSLSPIFFGQFSTPDVDNDEIDNSHCAREFKSGWWFNRYCDEVNLNQPYPKYKQDMTYYNMFWEGWYCINPDETALRFVSMNFYHNHNERN